MSKTRRADLEAALRYIACVPQAYYGQGPEVIARNMEQAARDALSGKWAGVAGHATPGEKRQAREAWAAGAL